MIDRIRNLLRGEKMYLTANKRENVHQWSQWFNDFDFATYASFHLQITNDDQQLQRLDRSRDRGQILFAIHAIENDRYIGVCSFEPPDMRNRSTMLGISIGDADYRGKGYGTDTMHVMLRYAFLEMNMNRVELGVFSYNEHAIHIYEKLGFVHEGRMPESLYRDGRYYDMIVMGILQSEWFARQQSGG